MESPGDDGDAYSMSGKGWAIYLIIGKIDSLIMQIFELITVKLQLKNFVF